MSDKGPNDLEATIERLEFRNEKLHQHNKKNRTRNYRVKKR